MLKFCLLMLITFWICLASHNENVLFLLTQGMILKSEQEMLYNSLIFFA